MLMLVLVMVIIVCCLCWCVFSSIELCDVYLIVLFIRLFISVDSRV